MAPELAVGLMLLAASPGGATANLFSHLAKGDVALNITLTAVNSVLSLLTLPLIVNFALEPFMGAGQSSRCSSSKVVQVFAIVLVPVGDRHGWCAPSDPTSRERLERPVQLLSAVVLLLVVAGAVLKERAHIGDYFQQVGLAALAFNLASMAVGYFVPRLLGIAERQAIAIGMEIGIHNGTLAIAIAAARRC